VDITKVQERVATALGEPTITAGGTTDEWMSLTRSVLTTLCAGVDLATATSRCVLLSSPVGGSDPSHCGLAEPL
jgi:hypothetical protein